MHYIQIHVHDLLYLYMVYVLLRVPWNGNLHRISLIFSKFKVFFQVNVFVFHEVEIFIKFPWPSSLGIERFLIGHAWDPIPRYEVRSREDTICTVWPKWKCFGIKIRFDLPQRPVDGHGGGSSVEKFYVTYMQNLMQNREKSQFFLSYHHAMVKFHSFIDYYV